MFLNLLILLLVFLIITLNSNNNNIIEATFVNDKDPILVTDSGKETHCPNECSGHGSCSNNKGCECFPSYHGIDCSSRLCPAGVAWFDFPKSSNKAHSTLTECSNMGSCNRYTGICKCRSGFGGPACDKMICPTKIDSTYTSGVTLPCFGNGQCLSVKQAALKQDYITLYDSINNYNDWDSDMVHACLCDSGWKGAGCDVKSCPSGWDPNSGGVSERQIIDCKCVGTSCSGGIYIKIRGQQTKKIPWASSTLGIQKALHRLNGIDNVNVTFHNNTQTLCSTGRGSVTVLEFLVPQNKVDTIIATAPDITSAGGSINVFSKGTASPLLPFLASRESTKIINECSNRGKCNNVTGGCECFKGWQSSNGIGDFGERGDCGHRHLQNSTEFNTATNSRITSKCPFSFELICSGNGTCDENTGLCTCNNGYEGGDCTLLSCPSSRKWWGDITLSRTTTSVCGGVGDCDHNTGKCYNCGGAFNYFTGTGCEKMSCAYGTNRDGNVAECSSNGVCMSLKEMAPYSYNDFKELAHYNYTLPWDADMVKGCACYRSVSVDNTFYQDFVIPKDGSSFATGIQVDNAGEAVLSDVSLAFDLTKYYRGPFSNSATDFTGFACSDGKCPKGDDPMTPYGVNEIQRFDCKANAGTFQIFFRENITMFIPYNSNISNFKTSLQQMMTINKVDITMYNKNNTRINNHDFICSPEYDDRYLHIEFLSEFGDLPLMQAVSSTLTFNGVSSQASINITEIVKGNKEDIECSGQGICQNSGICSCIPGFMSSNGSLNTPGERGDCSYFNPLYTNIEKGDVLSPNYNLNVVRDAVNT